MKKILLPLSLSLIIVLGLAYVAAPKKSPATPTQTEKTDLDRLADETLKNDAATDNVTLSGETASSETPKAETGSTQSGTVAEPVASGSGTETLVCTDEYAPVCGSDKNTYPNACAAKRMNVESTPGACAKDAATEGEAGSEPGNPGTGETGAGTGGETVALTGSTNMPTVNPNGLPYDNAGLGYGFVLPKSSYFSGFGARDGASHSVGIGKNASPESFELSEVKVRFYKGKVLSQLQNAENGFYEDAENGITYLSVNGSTITIEGDRSVSGGIIDSVIASAYVR